MKEKKKINKRIAVENEKYKKTYSEDLGSTGRHAESSVRLLRIRKSVNGSVGFDLTRNKWDPYPWVSRIDATSPAERFGLKAGDCVLEVNGEDILGLNVNEIAKLVQSKPSEVTLLLWNSGCYDRSCDPESLCKAPMSVSLQRLSGIVNSIVGILECPICFDTILPPIMNCQNGHLICVDCRVKAEKCPVCRDRFSPHPSLLAEQLYTTISNPFYSLRNDNKLQKKIFGSRPYSTSSKLPATSAASAPASFVATTSKETQRNICERLNAKDLKFSAKERHQNAVNGLSGVNKSLRIMNEAVKGNYGHRTGRYCYNKSMSKDKFLEKLLQRKPYSIDALSTNQDPKGNKANEFIAISTTNSNPLENLNHLENFNKTFSTNKMDNDDDDVDEGDEEGEGENFSTKLSKIFSFSANDLYELKDCNGHSAPFGRFPKNQISSVFSLNQQQSPQMPLTPPKPQSPCYCSAKSISHNIEQQHLKGNPSFLLFVGKRRPCTSAIINCMSCCMPDNQDSFTATTTTHSSLSSGINASMDSELSSMPLSNSNFNSDSTLPSTKANSSSSSTSVLVSSISYPSSPSSSCSKAILEKSRNSPRPEVKLLSGNQYSSESTEHNDKKPQSESKSESESIESLMTAKPIEELQPKGEAGGGKSFISIATNSVTKGLKGMEATNTITAASSELTKDSKLLTLAVPMASPATSCASVELTEAPVVASSSPIMTLESLLSSSTSTTSASASTSITKSKSTHLLSSSSQLLPVISSTSSPSPLPSPSLSSYLSSSLSSSSPSASSSALSSSITLSSHAFSITSQHSTNNLCHNHSQDDSVGNVNGEQEQQREPLREGEGEPREDTECLSTSTTTTTTTSATTTTTLIEKEENSNLLTLENGKIIKKSYLCPCCECKAIFEDSVQLLTHIKTLHSLPVVHFLSSKAQLSLPLGQPLKDSILILELSESPQKDSNALERLANCQSSPKKKECWLNLQLKGREKLCATLVLQSQSDDSCILSIGSKSDQGDRAR